MIQFLAKSLLLILLLSSFSIAQNPQSIETVTQEFDGKNVTQSIYYYTQVLDHFNTTDFRVWKQRYSVYDEYFNPKNGTVFIYIGGEFAQKSVTSGWVISLCKKYSAMVIGIEHRFYGASQPFSKDENTYSTTNLLYLTVDQALEDLAQFIYKLKSIQMYGIQERNPIITIGGSYPGAISAWIRSKYPHLVAGALASSAVINAIEDFSMYDYQMYTSTARSGEWCPKNIQKFNQQIENDQASFTKAINAFNANHLSREEFFYYFTDVQAYMVQYGYRVSLCNMFKQNTTFDQQLKKLSTYGKNYYSALYSGSAFIKNTTYDENMSGRQYQWQSCYQLGWFGTVNNVQPMKSKQIDLNYFKQLCKNVFGEKYTTPDVKSINTRFGGDKIKGTNIIFTNGNEDGWQWASLLKSTSDLESLTCEGCGHCAEFAQPLNTDSESLKKMRSRIEQVFSQWINDYLNNQSTVKRMLSKRD